MHTDIGGPLNESLGASICFMTALEDSTGFITTTPIKTEGMALDVLKTRITQHVTLTGTKVKRVRHDGAKKNVTKGLKAWYEDKGVTSEMTAPYKSQQNGKAERVNRTLMERVRTALLDAGAEEELWAEALASVVHDLNRSPKAGLDVSRWRLLRVDAPTSRDSAFGGIGLGRSNTRRSSVFWSQGPTSATFSATLSVARPTAFSRMRRTKSSSVETC